jgi:methylphosphotriester-DNA--protein-cysteine methyltransferase
MSEEKPKLTKRGKPRKKMGRPKYTVSIVDLAELCRMSPSQQEAANYFMVSPDYIARKIKEETGQTFSEFREKHATASRYALIRKATQMAMEGNSQMMQFVLKNKAGWVDKKETQVTVTAKPSIIHKLDGSKESLGFIDVESQKMIGVDDDEDNS